MDTTPKCQAIAPDVRIGSGAEELNLSISSPLRPLIADMARTSRPVRDGPKGDLAANGFAQAPRHFFRIFRSFTRSRAECRCEFGFEFARERPGGGDLQHRAIDGEARARQRLERRVETRRGLFSRAPRRTGQTASGACRRGSVNARSANRARCASRSLSLTNTPARSRRRSGRSRCRMACGDRRRSVASLGNAGEVTLRPSQRPEM